MKKEYYATLGVGEDATQEEIKAAYKSQAQRKHPDKGGSAEEFKQLQEANNILSNEGQRARYDNGEEVSQREATMAEKTRSQLAALFEAHVQQADDHVDLIQSIRTSLEAGIFKMQQEIAKADQFIKQMNHVPARVKYKGEGTDMFHAFTSAKIAKATENKRSIEGSLEVMEATKPLLDEYECSVEEGGVATLYRSYGSPLYNNTTV